MVYFAADEEDIDSEDAQSTDILLACTRRLLKDLQKIANPHPVLNWLKERWQDLKDLAQTEIEFEKLTVEAQLSQFAKLTANLRAVPELRQKIRKKVNPHTVTLIKVLNDFLAEAQKQLPNGCKKLALIVDNLDRMVLVKDGENPNYEEVFLDRSEQLKALNCHLIYTIPISMMYSKRATDLRDTYGECVILPMIMVKKITGENYELGLEKVKEVAIASYDQSLKFKPDKHEAWYNRGIALRQLERYDDAIASYDQALKFKPDYHQASTAEEMGSS